MNEFKSAPIEYPKKPGEAVSWDHYFRIMNHVFENIGEDSPLYQMASELCSKFGIPSGPASALTRNNFDPEKESKAYIKAKENDKTIGTVFAHIPGVYVGMGKNQVKKLVFFKEKAPLVTMDINKILDALEEGQKSINIKFQEFISALPEKDAAIILAERDLRSKKRKQFGVSKIDVEENFPLVYFRLSGGVGVFLRGYGHHREWQKNFGAELIDIYSHNSSLVLIEGGYLIPFGQSLAKNWKSDAHNHGYDILMRGIAGKNSNILFGEVDGRDETKVSMDADHEWNSTNQLNYANLPIEFYVNYYAYLKKINPKFSIHIQNPEDLKTLLKLQSTSDQGALRRDFDLKDRDTGIKFHGNSSITQEGKSSSYMTGFEFGQMMYSDALSAVKLHLLAKLSADKHLSSNSITDFEGSAHLSGKTFFMQYPQYALMVVLMNIHELMAGHTKKVNSNAETAVQYSREIFSNPNWEEVVKEILQLSIFSVETDPDKTTDVGLNQKKLIDQTPDFANIYGIDTAKIASELKELLEKTIQK